MFAGDLVRGAVLEPGQDDECVLDRYLEEPRDLAQSLPSFGVEASEVSRFSGSSDG